MVSKYTSIASKAKLNYACLLYEILLYKSRKLEIQKSIFQ